MLPADGTTEAPLKNKAALQEQNGVCVSLHSANSYIPATVRTFCKGLGEERETFAELENQWYLALLRLHFSRDIQNNFVNHFAVKSIKGKRQSNHLG